ncbi:MAG: 1-deoxy-D-xylulose-5-phosphate synthase [Firmicutes bacterium]|nr:1-deoxy-D-xylulose-5-phosphate synthase [Bacillota bacterium]
MKKIEQGIYPSDIKDLNIEELQKLAHKIRKKLIVSVSETGGHLASNLGVVELTLALHKVFDAPKDKIIWDVGHQSYVHKLITGRGDRFGTLRQMDGISGFPKREESPYDTFDTGHSSNSISAALGMVAARDLRGENNSVIAVIGDGSFTGGMVYEAMNNAGVMDTGLIIILNDNEMSISKNEGSMSQSLRKMRTSEKYNRIKKSLKEKLNKTPSGSKLYNGLHTLRDVVKYMTVPGTFFEELGIRYFGPVDGHNLEELIDVLSQVKQLNRPVVVHCVTKKGKGYKPAERRPDKYHGVSEFDPRKGIQASSDKKLSYSDVFGNTLCRLAEKDKSIVAISAAMISGTGLSGFAEKYPDRMFDVGIAEEHAVTFAAGLAASGMKPVVAVYSTFLQRAYDQILIDVCMQGLPVIFAIDRAGVVGADGETHHGVFDISYLSHMPGLTVLAPSDETELEKAIEYAMTLNGPCAIRYPRGTALKSAERTSAWRPAPYVFRAGKDIMLVGVGKMTDNCLKAADILKKQGINAGVIDARKIRPLTEEDKDVYRRSSFSGRLLVVEDNVCTGGFGNIIESIFAADPKVKVYKMGWPDEFIAHGTQKQLEALWGLDPSGIADKVREIIERKA